MNSRPSFLAIIGLVVAAGSTPAQEAQPVAIAAYYQCDPAREARADTIMRTIGDIVARQVAAGHVTGWGWLSHQLGGTWRRALYYVGPNRDALLNARTRILQEVNAEQARASREFSQICPTHDDYMWEPIAASTALLDVGRMRASASLSQYYQCDPARLSRADELLRNVIGPFASTQIRNGTINAWSWNARSLGGEYDRLLIMDGLDAKALLNARDGVFKAMRSERDAALREFESICPRRHDYVWGISIAEPPPASR